MIDATNDKVIATLAPNDDGTVSVIRRRNPNEYESVGDIRTQKSAKTMAFDRETVTRGLQQFRREKLIAIKGSWLTFLRQRALEQLAW
jgi:hypothetical protein